ncbi:MAG: hypothetical protein WD491_01485 [Balneolales bacterium]
MNILHSPKVIIGSLAFLLFAGISTASAQFEGSLEVNRYSISQDGSEDLKANYNLSLSPERILFSNAEGAKAIDMMGAIEANAILVRNDIEDFVFLGNRSEAVVLQKKELLSMISLMENMKGMNESNSSQGTNSKKRFAETSETQTIDGYSAKKWLMQTAGSNEVFHVWLTDEMNIEWGLLSEPWLTDLTLFSDLPFTEWMSKGQSPILVERFVGDVLTDRIAMENIEQKSIPGNRFDIPEGTEIVTFQQLLLQRMSGM